jgi:predicted transcriptional regulator
VKSSDICSDIGIVHFRKKENPMSSISATSYSTTAGLVSSATSWSASDVATLKSLAEKGMGANAIASQLDKSVTAVTKKINAMGLSLTSK